ncbi:MAG: hypothetical protein ABF303_02305, partial [Desulfobacterales bacterium]
MNFTSLLMTLAVLSARNFPQRQSAYCAKSNTFTPPNTTDFKTELSKKIRLWRQSADDRQHVVFLHRIAA